MPDSIWNEQCGLCGTCFNLNNLKNESRKKVDEGLKAFFVNLYNAQNDQIVPDSFLCKACNRLIDQLIGAVEKARTLRESLLGKVGGPLWKHFNVRVSDESQHFMPESPVPSVTNQSKRKRQLKYTPGASPATKTTKSSVRRELLMSPSTSTNTGITNRSIQGKSPRVNVCIISILYTVHFEFGHMI